MSTPQRQGGSFATASQVNPHQHHDELHGAIFPSGKDFFAWLTTGFVGAILLFFSFTAGEIFAPGISPGDVAEKDIRAPQDATVIDAEATKSSEEEARQHVIPDFVVDRGHDQTTLDRVKQHFDNIENLQNLGIQPLPQLSALGVEPDQHVFILTTSESIYQQLTGTSSQPITDNYVGLLKNRLESPPYPALKVKGKSKPRSLPPPVPPGELLSKERSALGRYEKQHGAIDKNELLIAVTIPPAQLIAFEEIVLASANRICQQFSRFPVTNKSEWEGIVVEFLPDTWTVPLRKTISVLVSQALEPNLVIDPAATKSKADHAVRMVKPVTREIKKDEIVIKRGEIITDERQQVLQALSIQSVKSTTLLFVLGISLLAALGFTGLFLLTYEPKLFFSSTSIALMYTVGIVTSVLTALLGSTYPQFVPISGAALVLTIFFRRRVAAALILPIIVLLFVGGLINGSHLLALTIGAIAAILTYSRRPNSLVFTGLVVGVAQALGFLIAFVIGKGIPVVFGAHLAPYLVAWLPASTPDLQSVGLQFAGGIASSIVAIGSLPFLENIFGMVTPFRLVELTDAEQPLLRQLEEKAPGTYQHSLAVANLAEAGAKAIHADANLVRAGALYHDIGKMVKPKFFIENQLGATNPHDSMTPEESRSRVLAHVTDGIELAKKYALPKAVQDFIPMHQGTTLMAYFYHKACQRDGVENVDASFYRYPGPKPQSKETAIVMLADVSEAVTHSMKDPSEQEVDDAIEKVFENRWQDGQFNESSLTYDELHRVKLSFVRVWRTLHHDRLKYPATTTGRMAVPPTEDKSGSNGKAAEKDAVSSVVAVAEPPAIDDGPCDCVVAEFGPSMDLGHDQVHHVAEPEGQPAQKQVPD